MKKIVKMFFICIGAFLTLDAIAITSVANFTFGIVFTFLAGVFFLCLGIFLEKIIILSSHGPLKWFKYLVYLGIAMILLMSFSLYIYGNNDNSTNHEDIVFVLGGAVNGETVSVPLKARLDKAIEYYYLNPSAKLIVTGSKGEFEDITEAEAMRRYLVKNSIPPENIIKEEKATSTYENLIYSSEIADKILKENYTVLIITNDFHIYRSLAMAKYLGIKATHIHAPTQASTIPINYLRECAAIFKFWVLKF